MKGTTRKIEGWGNYSRTNRSQRPLEFRNHQVANNLGRNVSQMRPDEIFGFRATKSFNLATEWTAGN